MQVANYNQYKEHYDQNPTTAFPPIPSVPVTVPVDHHTLHMLCFTARYEPHGGMHIPEVDIQRTIAAILDAAQLLDQDPHLRELQRSQQSKSGKAARSYFLKRNASYGGLRQLKFSLTSKHQLQEEGSGGGTGVCKADYGDDQQGETCGR